MDCSGAQGASHTQGLVEVARPHRSLQAVNTLIGLSDDIGGIGERQHGKHGAKYFLAGNRHVIAHAIENRGLHITATGFNQGPLTTRKQLRTFALTGLDVAQHIVELGLVHDGTHQGRLVQGIAGLILRHQRQRLFKKRLLDRCLDEQARRRIAAFALIEEDTAHGGFDRGIEIRTVGKHNIG